MGSKCSEKRKEKQEKAGQRSATHNWGLTYTGCSNPLVISPLVRPLENYGLDANCPTIMAEELGDLFVWSYSLSSSLSTFLSYSAIYQGVNSQKLLNGVFCVTMYPHPHPRKSDSD